MRHLWERRFCKRWSASGGTCLGASDAPVTGLSIDTRSLAKGEGFIAIRGPNRDGHAFVAAALEQKIADLFGDRIIPFDISAAEASAKIVARARRQGHTISIADGQIAGIAASRKLTVASRDGIHPRMAAEPPVVGRPATS